MAENVIERILKIDVEGSVRSLQELNDEVAKNQKALDNATEGTIEYNQAQAALRKSQQDYSYAVRMNVADTKSAAGSYNDLVAIMGRLKQEWRATNDEVKRAELGKNIDLINTQLKELDATVGVHSRNVGDYAEQMKKGLRDVPSYANAIKSPLKDISDQVGLLGKQPLFGIITLLTPLVIKIVDELKESENAMQALNKISKAFEPVLGFFQNVISTLAEYLGDIVGKVLEFTQGGLFKKIIDGVVGVGNAIVNFVVAPFKGIIAAIKVFKEQGVKGLGDAGKAFLAEMKQGVAFKSNYEAGQAMADAMAAGYKSKKKDVVNAAREVAAEVRSELMTIDERWFEQEDKWLIELRRKREEQAALDKEVLADIAAQEKEIADNMKAYYDEQAAAAQAAQDALKARRDMVVASGEAIESILGSVAQAYNTEIQAELNAGKIGEKEARKRFAFVKAFQLAQAILNTASGVMSVFSAPDNITMTQKWLQAAAVTARGAASIASIKSSNINTGAAASQATQVTSLMNAGQTAPAVQTLVPITRVGTNAEDEERLNELQRSQRVYVVYSDIAEVGNRVDVVQAESGF